MSTKIASLFVEIGARVDGLTRGLRDAKSQTTGAASVFKGLVATVGTVAAAATAAGLALKAAFDLGAEGANIAQVESSFNSLLDSLGAAPNTLQQMQDATRSTVSQFDLMSSSTTFLKGATGELGVALADALPELAGIAQAAHDLNPTMGTTADYFDRLTRGIRKAEPELLDEMGILIRMDKVYADYAKGIGKSVDQLTAEEKAIATLNAVKSQGVVLTNQATKVNTGATDAVDKLKAAIKDEANEFKEGLAPAIEYAATAARYMVIGTDETVNELKRAEDQSFRTSQTFTEYASSLASATKGTGYMVNELGDLVLRLNTVGDGADKVIYDNFAVAQSSWAAAKSFQALADQGRALDGGLSTLDFKAQGFFASVTNLDGGLSRLGAGPLMTVEEKLAAQAEDVANLQQGWDAYGDRLQAAADASAYTALTMDQLAVMSYALAYGIEGTLGNAMDQYTAGLSELQTQQAAIVEQMGELEARGATNSEQYAQLTEALNQNKLAQEGALASLQQLTAETIYQQAAVGLDTQAALDLARSMGVLSEADYATATAVATLRQEFDANADGAISAAEGSARYAASVELVNRAVASLQAKGLPVTLDNITNEMAELAKTDAGAAVSATSGAAEEGAGNLEDFGSAASDAGGDTNDVGSAAEDAASALKDIAGAAGGASSGLNTIRGSAEKAAGPLRNAASAAGTLAENMRDIPRGVSISASASGFESAIGWVQKLTDALNSVPSSVSASINLSTSGGGGTGGGGGGPPPRLQGVAAPAVGNTTNITNNVYDPMAAAILAAQQSAASARQLEELME